MVQGLCGAVSRRDRPGSPVEPRPSMQTPTGRRRALPQQTDGLVDGAGTDRRFDARRPQTRRYHLRLERLHACQLNQIVVMGIGGNLFVRHIQPSAFRSAPCRTLFDARLGAPVPDTLACAGSVVNPLVGQPQAGRKVPCAWGRIDLRDVGCSAWLRRGDPLERAWADTWGKGFGGRCHVRAGGHPGVSGVETASSELPGRSLIPPATLAEWRRSGSTDQ